jgi:hypothetical protein
MSSIIEWLDFHLKVSQLYKNFHFIPVIRTMRPKKLSSLSKFSIHTDNVFFRYLNSKSCLHYLNTFVSLMYMILSIFCSVLYIDRYTQANLFLIRILSLRGNLHFQFPLSLFERPETFYLFFLVQFSNHTTFKYRLLLILKS